MCTTRSPMVASTAALIPRTEARSLSEFAKARACRRRGPRVSRTPMSTRSTRPTWLRWRTAGLASALKLILDLLKFVKFVFLCCACCGKATVVVISRSWIKIGVTSLYYARCCADEEGTEYECKKRDASDTFSSAIAWLAMHWSFRLSTIH